MAAIFGQFPANFWFSGTLIRQPPDWSGSHQDKIRQVPDWSGNCQIEIRKLPDWSGPRFVRSLENIDDVEATFGAEFIM